MSAPVAGTDAAVLPPPARSRPHRGPGTAAPSQPPPPSFAAMRPAGTKPPPLGLGTDANVQPGADARAPRRSRRLLALLSPRGRTPGRSSPRAPPASPAVEPTEVLDGDASPAATPERSPLGPGPGRFSLRPSIDGTRPFFSRTWASSSSSVGAAPQRSASDPRAIPAAAPERRPSHASHANSEFGTSGSSAFRFARPSLDMRSRWAFPARSRSTSQRSHPHTSILPAQAQPASGHHYAAPPPHHQPASDDYTPRLSESTTTPGRLGTSASTSTTMTAAAPLRPAADAGGLPASPPTIETIPPSARPSQASSTTPRPSEHFLPDSALAIPAMLAASGRMEHDASGSTFDSSASAPLSVLTAPLRAKRGILQVSRKMRMPVGNGRLTFRGNKDWPAELAKDSAWQTCWMELSPESIFLYTGLESAPSNEERRTAVREASSSNGGKQSKAHQAQSVMVDELPLIMTTVRLPGVPAGTAGSQHSLVSSLMVPTSTGAVDTLQSPSSLGGPAVAGAPDTTHGSDSAALGPVLSNRTGISQSASKLGSHSHASRIFSKALMRSSHRPRDNVFELVSLNDRRFITARDATDLAEWVQAIREGIAEALLNLPSRRDVAPVHGEELLSTSALVPLQTNGTDGSDSGDGEPCTGPSPRFKHTGSLASSLDHSSTALSSASNIMHGSDLPAPTTATAGSSVSIPSALSDSLSPASYLGAHTQNTSAEAFSSQPGKVDHAASFSSVSAPAAASNSVIASPKNGLGVSNPASPPPSLAMDYAAEVRAIAQLPENRACADCQAPNPRWASWSLFEEPCCIFLCIQCTSVHRALGVHVSKVKSLDLDAWTEPQAAAARMWGNTRANAYWEHCLPPKFTRHAPSPWATTVVAQAMSAHPAGASPAAPSAGGPSTPSSSASEAPGGSAPTSPHAAADPPTSTSNSNSSSQLNHKPSHTSHGSQRSTSHTPRAHSAHSSVAHHLHSLHAHSRHFHHSERAERQEKPAESSDWSSLDDQAFFDAVLPEDQDRDRRSAQSGPGPAAPGAPASSTGSTGGASNILPALGSGFAVYTGWTGGGPSSHRTASPARGRSPATRVSASSPSAGGATPSPSALRPLRVVGASPARNKGQGLGQGPGQGDGQGVSPEQRERDLFWIYKYVERRWAPPGPFPETLWTYAAPPPPPSQPHTPSHLHTQSHSHPQALAGAGAAAPAASAFAAVTSTSASASASASASPASSPALGAHAAGDNRDTVRVERDRDWGRGFHHPLSPVVSTNSNPSQSL